MVYCESCESFSSDICILYNIQVHGGTVDLPTNLTTIHVIKSKISYIPESILKVEKLVELKVDFTGISGFTEESNKYSEHLSQNNRNSTNIKKLSADGNQFTDLKDSTFQIFPKLTDLSLAFNSISTIENETFSKLTELTTLNLSNNKIQKIFVFPRELQSLILSGNLFKLLNKKSFAYGNLETLYLNDNLIKELSNDTFNINIKEVDLCSNVLKFVTTNTTEVIKEIERQHLKCNETNLISCQNNLKVLEAGAVNFSQIYKDWQNCQLDIIKLNVEEKRLNGSLKTNQNYLNVHKKSLGHHIDKMNAKNKEDHTNFLIVRAVIILLGSIVCCFLLWFMRNRNNKSISRPQIQSRKMVHFSQSTKLE